MRVKQENAGKKEGGVARQRKQDMNILCGKKKYHHMAEHR